LRTIGTLQVKYRGGFSLLDLTPQAADEAAHPLMNPYERASERAKVSPKNAISCA